MVNHKADILMAKLRERCVIVSCLGISPSTENFAGSQIFPLCGGKVSPLFSGDGGIVVAVRNRHRR
jgi:hypothetical protein